VLPDNSDPDEFIRKSGTSEYQRQRGEAQPHIQFVIDQAVRGRKLSNPADKEAAIDEVLPYIRAVRSRIQKREYFDIAMDSLRIGDAALRRELWHSIRTGIGGGPRVAQTAFKRAPVKPTVAEIQLLELLLDDEIVRRIILPKLAPADYEGLPTASIFKAIIAIENEGAELDFSSLSQKLDGDESGSELLPMLLMGDLRSPDEEKRDDLSLAAERCLDALRLINIDLRIRELIAEIGDAERAGDEAKLVRLSAEYSGLDRLRKSFEPQSQIAQAENA
jgi:DNA primase